jgi:hypothetical protein
MSGARSALATPHELSINLIEIEGEMYLWQTQMTREIRPKPPGSKAGSRVDSRADHKRNLVNHPLKAQA